MSDLAIPSSSPFDAIKREDKNGVNLAMLPGKRNDYRYVGYLYIVELSNGLTKVGKTSNPHKRISTHAEQASIYGFCVVKLWLSPPNMTADQCEKDLIAFGRKHSSSIVRSEYFTGLSFRAAVAFAETLTFKPVDPDEIAELEERARATSYFFTSGPISPPDETPQQQPDYLESLNAVIGSAFGRQTDGSYRVPESIKAEGLAELKPIMQELADHQGRDLEDVLQMSWLDMLEMIVATAVKTEALRLRAHAYDNELFHIVEPQGEHCNWLGLCDAPGPDLHAVPDGAS